MSHQIKVHTLKWHQDHAARPEEEATSTLYAIVEVDGVELEAAQGIELAFDNGFNSVKIQLAGMVEIVNHDADSWRWWQGVNSIDPDKDPRDPGGVILGMSPGDVPTQV